MVFEFQSMKNIGMPSRHISPQSFDTLLSDLGDDPAIPDPHGIRKSTTSKNSAPGFANPPKSPSFFEPLNPPAFLNQAKRWGTFMAAALCFAILILGLFLVYNASKSNPDTHLEDPKIQISKLQQDLVLMRKEMDTDFDSLYEEIDSLEVSIHLLKENKSNNKASTKPKPPADEKELRRWRYLGSSQMGDTQQAFFQQGKSQAMFSKGALVLGEWRLNLIEKEGATLTHPQGKSIVLHRAKSE